jgi:NitT/TauT family transport system substrate-binding protein
MKRKEIRSLTSLAAGVAMSACAIGAVPAAETTKLSVVLGYIPNVEMYGLEYALHEGLYKDEGLDVTLVPAGQGVDQVQMVAAGVVQIGIDNPEGIIAATAKNESFTVFAGQFQSQPIAMTCRKDSGVTKPADLKGKTIGVKTNAEPYFKLFLSKNGLQPSDVKTTSIGPNDISVLIAGRIACEITTFAFNEPRLIEAAGVPVTVLPLGEYGLNAQADSYFVKSSFFEKPENQAILAKFLHATGQGWVSFYKDPKAAAKYVIDHNFVDGLDIEQQTYQAEQQVKYMSSELTAHKGILWLDPAIWAQTAENVNESGVTPTVIPTAGMLTTSILEKADLPKF